MHELLFFIRLSQGTPSSCFVSVILFSTFSHNTDIFPSCRFLNQSPSRLSQRQMSSPHRFHRRGHLPNPPSQYLVELVSPENSSKGAHHQRACSEQLPLRYRMTSIFVFICTLCRCFSSCSIHNRALILKEKCFTSPHA